MLHLRNNRTTAPSGKNVNRKWWIVDAKDVVLGKVAVVAARKLRGKDKPEFMQNIDIGDHVVVINAGKVKLTGKKYEDKVYYHHTGYPGGIKERTAKQILEGKFPERIVFKAVKGMMGYAALGSNVQITRLHVYSGNSHPHAGQKPEALAAK